MNVFTQIEAQLQSVLAEILPTINLADFAIAVEPPRSGAHGDMATNAAMVLAKTAKMPPRQLAEAIAEKLEAVADITATQVAGPGFVNITLAPAFWQQHIKVITEAGADYGRGTDKQQKINIEYVSANPTGPMHVGHARGAVLGDVLANLLATAGYDITREYYINDAGGQINVLAQSVLLRAQGRQVPEGLYPSDYIIPIGQTLAAQTDFEAQDEATQIMSAKQVALPIIMDMIKDDLAALGIRHDVFSSEQSLHDRNMIDETLAQLEGQGLIYQGILEAPKGKPPSPEDREDWEEREQTLFRSTKFGDDSDRALKKSNGDWTYFAADIAYHFDKYQRGFTHQINIWGADHAGYIKRMKAAVEAITKGEAQLDVRTCNLVKLLRDGQPVKMSKRSGEFITLREVVDEVGKDAVRFMMLTRKNDAPLDFDFAQVKDKSRDNPIFYVQYANARICSVLDKAGETGTANYTRLQDVAELALIRKLANYPRIMAAAAEALEPHRIAFYLLDVAAAFHSLWNKGKDNPDLRFVMENDKALTADRLALLVATQQVLHCGMGVIGIEPQAEMR
ncbi:MAG: arginine--tRNA ligase [Alphaproteobacteria bacterium]|nr:arginine--tRNA ligase [Alphaproteobacteria bacterium]